MILFMGIRETPMILLSIAHHQKKKVHDRTDHSLAVSTWKTLFILSFLGVLYFTPVSMHCSRSGNILSESKSGSEVVIIGGATVVEVVGSRGPGNSWESLSFWHSGLKR